MDQEIQVYDVRVYGRIPSPRILTTSREELLSLVDRLIQEDRVRGILMQKITMSKSEYDRLEDL